MSERTLDYTPVVGPGVDALNARKEHGCLSEITEAGLRAAIDRSIDRVKAALKLLTEGS